MNNPTFYLNKLEKKKIKCKASRRRKLIKITAEIKMKQIIKTIGKKSTKLSWCFEKLNKTGKLLERLNKKK